MVRLRPIFESQYAVGRTASIRKIGSRVHAGCGLRAVCAKIVSMDAIDTLPLSCPHCAARMPETAAFCPGCGASMKEPERASGMVGILPQRIAGGLAYVTFLPAIVFLVARPYCRNSFVRFHSVQCLLFSLTTVALAALIRIAAFVFGMIPVVGPLIVVLLYAVAAIGAIVLWGVLLAKALQGEKFRLPLLGDFAEKYAAVP